MLETTGARAARPRYDDFGNVTRIVDDPDTDPSDETEDGRTCAGVPEDVGDNETYYCYDEFERLRLTKAAGSQAEPDTVDHDALDRRDFRTTTKNGEPVERDYSYIGMTELLSRDVEDDGTKRPPMIRDVHDGEATDACTPPA